MTTGYPITVEEFRRFFPEFDSISDEAIQLRINAATAIFCTNSDATLYLAAHLLALDIANNVGGLGDSSGGSLDGGSGVHTAESVGDVSVSMQPMTERNEDNFYATTPYGRQYLAFRNTTPSFVIPGRVVTGSCPPSSNSGGCC